MTRATRITKIKFYSINRDIKAAIESKSYHAPTIAKAHHVSDETVRSVRNAKTWPAFITAKQLRAVNQARRNAAAFAKTQSDAPKKRPLNPVQIQDPIQDQFVIDLKRLEATPTREEFNDTIHDLNTRIDIVVKLLRQKADKRVWPWSL